MFFTDILLGAQTSSWIVSEWFQFSAYVVDKRAAKRHTTTAEHRALETRLHQWKVEQLQRFIYIRIHISKYGGLMVRAEMLLIWTTHGQLSIFFSPLSNNYPFEWILPMMFASLTMCVYPSLDFARHFLDERMNEWTSNSCFHSQTTQFTKKNVFFVLSFVWMRKLQSSRRTRLAVRLLRVVVSSFFSPNFFFPFSIRYSVLGWHLFRCYYVYVMLSIIW